MGDHATKTDIDKDRRRGFGRWFVRIVVGCALLLSLAAAGLLVFLPAIASVVASRQLGALGVVAPRVRFRAVTPSCMVAGPVAFGDPEDRLSADQVVASYSLAGLRSGVVDEVVVSRLRATVHRQDDGSWRLAGLPPWPGARPADTPEGTAVQVRHIQLVGAVVTLDLGADQSVEIALDGDLLWKTANDISLSGTARLLGDSVAFNIRLDPSTGDGDAIVESEGMTLNRWRDQALSGPFGWASLPQVSGTAVVTVRTSLRGWQPQSFDVDVRGPSLSFSLDVPVASGAPPAASPYLTAGGCELVAPTVRIRGEREARNSGFSYRLTHALDCRQASAVSMTGHGLVRIFSGALQCRGSWRLAAGDVRPLEGDLTVAEVTAELPEATVMLESASCRLATGLDHAAWEVAASTRFREVHAGAWHAGEGILDVTVAPGRIDLNSSVFTIERAGDIAADLSLTGAVSGSAAVPVYDGRIDVQRLLLAETHRLEPFVVSASGNPERLTIATNALVPLEVPSLLLEDVSATVFLGPEAVRADLAGALRIDRGVWDSVPGRLAVDHETMRVDLSGRVSAGGDAPFLDLSLALPRQALSYRDERLGASSTVSLDLSLVGDLERLGVHGALRCSDLEVKAPMLDAGLPELVVELADGEIQPRRLLAAGTLSQVLARVGGRLHVMASEASLSIDRLLRAEKVEIALPAIWDGTEFVLSEGDRGRGAGFVTAGRLDVGPVSFGTSRIGLSVENRALRFRGRLSSADNSLDLDLGGAVSLSARPVCRIDIQADVPDLASAAWLSSWLSQSGRVAVRSLAGRLSVSGAATLAAAADPRGTVTVALEDGAFALEDPAVTATGVHARLRLDDLFRGVSPPHQEISFAELALGDMPFGEGRIRFQLEGETGLFVQRADVAWCGGTLSTYALSLTPGLQSLDILLYADSIDLGRLFALQDTVKGSASGTLYGKIPVHIRAGKLSYQSGFLYAVPGAGGKLKIENAEVLTQNLPHRDPRVGQAEAALRDLQYDVLRLDVDGHGDLTRLTIRVEGRSAVDSSLPPVKLNTTVEANINQLIDVGRQLHRLDFR